MLKSYNGNEPYIFISYAHKDSQIVVPAIEALQKKGYRIWFDLGIEAGTEWSNNIAQHLQECSAFVAFISKNSVKSENCLDEIAFAKSHQKNALMIFIEDDVTLPSGTEMQTARFQRMYLNRQETMDAFVANIEESSMLSVCKGDETQNEEQTSDAPATPKKKKSSKKGAKKIIISIVAAVLVLAVAVAAYLLFFNKDKVSKELEDYTFMLEEVVYQLPADYSQFSENGWEIDTDYIEDTIDGLSVVSTFMEKGEVQVYVGLFNPTGNAIPVQEGQIVSIEVELDERADFSIAKGITPASTKEEIIKAFGEPDEAEESSDGEMLYYGPEMYSTQGVMFNIYTDPEYAAYSSIKMVNYDKNVKTDDVTNDEVPQYITEYTAPTKLGDDLFSRVVEIDGELYKLPAPIKEFIDNGWELDADEDYLVAGENSYAVLEKDKNSLSVTLENFADYQTTIENCVVTDISVYEYDKAEIKLPGGIYIGQPEKEFLDIINEYDDIDIYNGTYNTSYSYYDYEDKGISLDISVGDETKKVESISVRYEEGY